MLLSLLLFPFPLTPHDHYPPTHAHARSHACATAAAAIFMRVPARCRALPMVHTLSRNKSAAAIKSGSYANLRIYGISGNMNPDMPWTTLKAALESNPDQDSSLFMQFSSTCYYFGESLTEELAKSGPAPPIGLIHTAWGGSTIEQWLDNRTIATCANTSISAANGEWHETRVMPYIDMTVKGWVWYQGENDMHGVFGNSGRKTGYSCMMPALVDSWRKLWSAEAGTTDPTAPFGLVTLAPSGGEGGNDIGTMRWAQTAGYGTPPTPRCRTPSSLKLTTSMTRFPTLPAITYLAAP